MESNELFNEIKSISEKLKEIFNPIQESEIISNFYICILEDQLYRNILANFFNNLTEENIKDCNLLASDIKIIKKDFKKIQKDINISAENIYEVIFTKSYYYSSKREILAKYPTLEKIFNEIEKVLDLYSIEDFIKKQKLVYSKDKNDYRTILNTLILEDLIKNKHFEDISQLNQKDLTELIDIKELSDKLLEKSMQITKWEIWKTYSTYTNRTFNIGELKKLSEILVKNNIVTSIFSSDGSVIWKDEEKVKKDKIFDWNSSSKNLGFLKKLPDYAAEGIFQFYIMWNREERILKNMHFDYPYIKGFLSPINVTFTTEHKKLLYPQLTIYNTGILNLTFRIMSPDMFDYELNSFIYNEINSSNLKIEYIEIPYELLENLKDFEMGDLEKNRITAELGSFEHSFVKLENFENLMNLNQFLISVISFHISKKFRKIDYYNNYWLYSQSIYLLDYKNQPYHKEVPKDLREINLYCLFIIQGMFLWVSSKDELEKFKEDINNENKVYEKQILVEAINHFNLLVNKLYEISSNNKSYDDAIRLQKDLIYFQRLFKTSYLSNFGEINHILNYCYEELEWEELIKLSNELLDIEKDIEKNHQIKRKNENLQYLVIFIAFFTICSQLMFYYPHMKNILILINIIAFLIILILIFKEKISYALHVLKFLLNFLYNKIF